MIALAQFLELEDSGLVIRILRSRKSDLKLITPPGLRWVEHIKKKKL